MTANELVDELVWMSKNRGDSISRQLADIVRQQQAEIEALKLRYLTDEKIWKLWQTHLNDDITVFARAIENWIKNGN